MAAVPCGVSFTSESSSTEEMRPRGEKLCELHKSSSQDDDVIDWGGLSNSFPSLSPSVGFTPTEGGE